jgi:hypothetical protein
LRDEVVILVAAEAVNRLIQVRVLPDRCSPHLQSHSSGLQVTWTRGPERNLSGPPPEGRGHEAYTSLSAPAGTRPTTGARKT